MRHPTPVMDTHGLTATGITLDRGACGMLATGRHADTMDADITGSRRATTVTAIPITDAIVAN